MTTGSAPTGLLAFAAPGGPWGLALRGPQPALLLGDGEAGSPPRSVPVEAEPDGALRGEGVALRLSDDAAPLRRLDGELVGRGRIELRGVEAEISLGELAELDSQRVVLGWLDEDDAFAVSAARPRGAAGQERDLMRSVVHEPAGPVAVGEARLSTTYDGAGEVRRLSLELWPAGEEEAYPHRSAAEVSGPAGELTGAGFALRAYPLRCHRAGRDGFGVYVLARAR